MIDAWCASREHLGIDELDDVGVAAQALQQLDLVDEAGGRLVVAPRQPDALQRIYLPIRRHHLQACNPRHEHDDLHAVNASLAPSRMALFAAHHVSLDYFPIQSYGRSSLGCTKPKLHQEVQVRHGSSCRVP